MAETAQTASATSPAPTTRVSTLADLVAHFERGIKPEGRFRIGVEHEKIGVVLRDGLPVTPVPYEDAPGKPQIRDLFASLMAKGWQGSTDGSVDGQIISLKRDGASITLEPGGQFELSARPFDTGVEAAKDIDSHHEELLPLATELGIGFLACGFRPLGTWDDVPWMPKARYRVMRQYLPTRGTLGVEMMKRTATVQANLDYKSEADAMDKLRLSISLQSLVTAMYAASPLVDGRPSGYLSFRAACWLDTDPDRCGLLPFLYNEGASFADYAQWALDVPMFFVRRKGQYNPVIGLTFRRFLTEGWQGEHATLADWDLHLSTLFPETRLRQYVEVRGADSGPIELIRALPCLWRGTLYSDEGRRAAWDLIKGWSFEERQEVRAQVPLRGMAVKVGNTTLGELCERWVAIAMSGLRSLGSDEGARLLEPLAQIAEERRCPADGILDAFSQAKGDPRAFAKAILYT